MSGMEGVKSAQNRLTELDAAVKARVEAVLLEEAKKAQQDMANLAPVRTGQLRSLIESDEFVKEFKSRSGQKVEIGFRTKELRSKGRVYFFTEFGNKAYKAGDKRPNGKRARPGVDKKGRSQGTRTKTVQRGIPARPAYPFFRPAVAMLIERMKKRRAEAWALALADVAKRRVLE